MQTKQISRRLRRFLKADEAVSALEYAVLVGVVVVGVGGAIVAFSNNIEAAIAGVGAAVEATSNTAQTVDLTDGTAATP